MALPVLLQWLFNPFSCLYVIVALASICSTEQHSSAPSPKQFIYLCLKCSEDEAWPFRAFHGVYSAPLDLNYQEAFFFLFNPLSKSSGRGSSNLKRKRNSAIMKWEQISLCQISDHQASVLALKASERVAVICAGKQEVSGVILL